MSNLWAQFDKNVGKHCRFVPILDFRYSINISTKYNYLYVETPKVTCSTIKSVLQKAELNDPGFFRPDFEDIHNRGFSPLLTPLQVGNLDTFIENNKPFTFCFSRNPYSRLLSAYLDKIDSNRPQKKNVLLHLGKDISDLEQKVSFDEFVKVACEQPIANMDPHWRIQYYQTFQDSIDYDFMGKLENFKEDFVFVLEKLFIDHEKFLSDERRHAKGADKLVKDFYTPKLQKLVQEKYAQDFSYFDYKLDL